MTDLLATIRVTDADAFIAIEDAAEELCDLIADEISIAAPIVVHILVQDDEGRPLAERRIVGEEE